jgi:hypothetical protein
VNDKRNIEAAFARANVPLEITTGSLNRRLVKGGAEIVQLDIGNRRGKETILMNLPEDGDVRVLGGDSDHQQVVVMVKEPEREFVERFWNRVTAKTEDRTRKTPGATRRFLMGMDEQHLFIAQLSESSNATSVKQAHETLRPRTVPKGRKAKKQKVRRTGEWFLIPATLSEIAQVEDHIKVYGVRKKVGIGTGNGRRLAGRPHVVTESVLVGKVGFVRTEFVRGRILHPEHKVVKLKTWHKVQMNTEDRAVVSPAAPRRISRWVD